MDHLPPQQPTLSVSTMQMISPAANASPSLTLHSLIVPVSIVYICKRGGGGIQHRHNVSVLRTGNEEHETLEHRESGGVRSEADRCMCPALPKIMKRHGKYSTSVARMARVHYKYC